MNRTDFEQYLGKTVEVMLFDDDIIRGCLRKTHDEAFKNNPNLYIPQNYYFLTKDINSKICISYIFKVSHVKKLKEIQ